MVAEIIYTMDMAQVDWVEMKESVQRDDFDNGRTPAQLRLSFENSYAAVVAYAGERIVGSARVLSDGVGNAYLVDVWTLSAHRRQGIASSMIRRLMERLPGQHIYLQTDHAMGLYQSLGFTEQPTGMSVIVGQYLQNETARLS